MVEFSPTPRFSGEAELLEFRLFDKQIERELGLHLFPN
jgi:hypothetical protein